MNRLARRAATILSKHGIYRLQQASNFAGAAGTSLTVNLPNVPRVGKVLIAGTLSASANADGQIRPPGRTVTDGVTTNLSPIVTSATAAFTSDDVGKLVIGNGIPASTTILSRQSATQVTLSANATATASGVSLFVAGWFRAAAAAPASSAPRASIWYKPVVASEPQSITFTFTNAAIEFMAVEEWTGIQAVVDKSASASNAASVTTLTIGPTAATTVAATLAWAMWGTNSSAGTFNAPSDGFSLNLVGGRMAYGTKILAATGTVQVTATWTSARTAAGALAVFKAA